MKLTKITSFLFACLCLCSLSFLTACDDDEQVQQCNNGNYDEIEWLQDEIAKLDTTGRPESRIEIYEYNNQIMFFSIPTNIPRPGLPCILYTCNQSQVCVITDTQNTCQDFINRRTFIREYWSK